MSDKVMTESELLRSTESPSEFSDIEAFVTNVSKALEAESIARENVPAILLFGFRNFLDATRDAPAEAEKAILKWIVPACLEAGQELGGADLDALRMRELLATWVDQYADEHRVPLRAKVLAAVESTLNSSSPIPAVWTASVIGLRTPQLEFNLQSLAQRNNNVGDAAIECLASLSPDMKTTRQIVQRVLRRLPTRKVRDFFSAISTTGDTRFIPALSRKLFGEGDEEMVIVSLLGRIADRAPLDEEVQAHVWRVFRRALSGDKKLLGSVLFTGNGITLCNKKEVIPSLTRLLVEKRTGSHLVFGRLKDCVRPIQLEGWSFVEKGRLKALLSSAATFITGNSTLSMTVDDHSRRSAWDTALAAGISDVDDWLTAAMVERSGPFEKADALTFSSYYQWDSWPELAEKLVLDQFSLEERKGVPIADRTAAVEFFFAIGTHNALRTILNTGLTAHGSPLRSTARAAADLAVWLAQSDADRVVQELLRVCESPENSNGRMLAIVGLESLADQHLIPLGELSRLAIVAEDPSLPSYATSAAIWATSCYTEAVSLPGYVAFLTGRLASAESDLKVRFQCFQSLVRLGIWKDYEQEFVRALELIGPSPRLVPSKPQGYHAWQALLLTQLAMRAPEQFLYATTEVINNAGADAVHAVLQVCTGAHDPPTPVLEGVAEAAITRVLRVFNSYYAEADMLIRIAHIAPGEFVRAEWEQAWGGWMPNARAALARAIEQNVSDFPGDAKPRLLDVLEMLLSDSVYHVRRIAARAYAKVDISALSDLCHYWSESGNSGLRLRAAEIAQYVPSDDSPSMDNEVLRVLNQDPEKSIRNAAADGIAALRNRIWADQLLERIRSGRDLAPNQWVAECYRYGRALAEIGDDETLESLRALILDRAVPPNVRNWLQGIENALDEHWKTVTRNWPEPTFPWAGALEEVQTPFSLNERSLSARLLLWRQRPADPGGVLSWGGSFFEPPGFKSLRHFLESGTEPRSLRIHGRRDAQIWIGSVGTHGLVSFVGNGPYPEVLSGAEQHEQI